MACKQKWKQRAKTKEWDFPLCLPHCVAKQALLGGAAKEAESAELKSGYSQIAQLLLLVFGSGFRDLSSNSSLAMTEDGSGRAPFLCTEGPRSKPWCRSRSESLFGSATPRFQSV